MDFWSALVLPALSGQADRVRRTAHHLRRQTPLPGRARLDATTARAMLILGDAESAAVRLSDALVFGDLEAEALARITFPDGEQIAARHLLTRPPGEAADAGCDLAWLRHRRGDRHGARAAVFSALQACPDHIEARSWQRALEAPSPRLGTLAPTRAAGWLSPVRLRRRPHGHVLPVLDGALGRLRHAGVLGRRLASTTEYSAAIETDLRATLEVALADAWAMLRAGGSTRPALEAIWRAALRAPQPVRMRVAQATVELSLMAPERSRAGLAAAEVLALARPGVARWQAALARLLADAGEDGSEALARGVLSRRGLDAESWRLAVSALQQRGHMREVRATAEDALARPALSAAAYGVLMEGGSN